MTSDRLIYFAPFRIKSKMKKPCHRHFPALTASCWFRLKMVALAAHLEATSFPADPGLIRRRCRSWSRSRRSLRFSKSTFLFSLPLVAWYLMKTRLSDSQAESDELNRIVTGLSSRLCFGRLQSDFH